MVQHNLKLSHIHKKERKLENYKIKLKRVEVTKNQLYYLVQMHQSNIN